MFSEKVIRAACYLKISTKAQELDNQRAEIMSFIERRGWKLVHRFEDMMSGRKTERDRPGFAVMLMAAHQRKFDIVVFWALDWDRPVQVHYSHIINDRIIHPPQPRLRHAQ